MRLTIISIILISLAATVLYLTESKEIEQEKRVEVIRKARIAELEAEEQRRDSILNVAMNSTDLDSLDLSGFELSKLPKAISRLKKLKYLNLSNNNFQFFPEILTTLPNLETLDFSNNNLWEISLIDTCSVKKLDISHNQLPYFPDIIEKFPNIEILDISHNEVSGLIFFTSSQSLQTLNFSFNNIISIHFLEMLATLENLDVSNNGLEKIPILPSTLVTLNLKNNDIQDLSNLGLMIPVLENLKELNMGHNNFDRFDYYPLIKNVEKLILEGNTLIDVSALSKYNKLKYLDLQSCDLSDVVVQVIGGFESLEYLNLVRSKPIALNINSESLNKLVISECEFEVGIGIISAPNLERVFAQRSTYCKDPDLFQDLEAVLDSMTQIICETNSGVEF